MHQSDGCATKPCDLFGLRNDEDTDVPHAKHKAVESPVGIVGRSGDGIDFQAIDGQRVDLVFLVISPIDNAQRLAALKQVSLFVQHKDLCRFLREAGDSAQAYEIFQEAETRLHEVE